MQAFHFAPGWGGHGRTGTLVALLLSSLYGVNAHVALEYTQALHDSRGNPQGVRSPQTRIQRDQVGAPGWQGFGDSDDARIL
jgi:hypothetical protein